MRRLFASVAFLIPLTLTAAASADDKANCPPGSWFCESVEVQVGDDDEGAADPDSPPASTKKRVTVDEDELASSPDDAPEAADATPVKKVKKRKKKRVIVEEDDVEVDGEETVVVVKKKKHRKAKPAVEAVGPKGKVKKQRRWRERFGLNLRIEGAAFAGRYENVVGMGGAGASFRWRPSPYFAFDIGADIIGGRDYNDDERIEFSGALSGMVYFNPQHRVQVYGIGGIHLSHAEVETWDNTMVDDWTTSESRNYFGGHGGLGIEFRISRHFAMFVDALALIRTRIDDDQPEFRNPSTGEGTNVSGAGLFRTGVTFWW
ncbi:MAG: outer membrane beta-barrel protein [Polyangiaceae bacterium]|jgi:opacity protein-like surface antigen|nr:outer membrane beta-barrel protein [Polyangiaceae bacterium]MBK8942789.1 outer membrane beta-barrel protein [Polyangiaceae bacterium]